MVSARGADRLDSLVADITARGGDAVAVVADVTNLDQVQAVADTALVSYGRIDTSVNCAGVALFAPFEPTTAEQSWGSSTSTLWAKCTGRKSLCRISVNAAAASSACLAGQPDQRHARNHEHPTFDNACRGVRAAFPVLRPLMLPERDCSAAGRDLSVSKPRCDGTVPLLLHRGGPAALPVQQLGELGHSDRR